MPEDEDWRAVSTAVTERMREIGVTAAEIHRRTGMSEKTFYDVTLIRGRPTRSTLTLLSLFLEWREDHLYNILRGRADENTARESPAERYLVQLVQEKLTGIDTLREEVSELKEVVDRIDGKVDVVIARQQGPGGDDAEP